ncbi:hypothetical protein FHS14_001224 [Paenibacillus baekrokdamisoli]|nr:hypothetical protein [Paenibacillus baekrokdamisoli]
MKVLKPFLLAGTIILLIMGNSNCSLVGAKDGSEKKTDIAMGHMSLNEDESVVNPDTQHNAHPNHGHMDMDMEMELAPVQSEGIQVKWSWASGMPKAGETAKLRMTIMDAEGMPIPVKQLEISHEKKLHLILVSRGLSQFMHVHPVETGEPGVFEVPVTFPAAGDYKLIADFRPVGGNPLWRSEWVEVQGEAMHEPVLLTDKQLERSTGGMNVSLTFAHPPQAGQEDEMTFTFEEKASGAAVTDLEPYLGAVGHVVIVDSEVENYLHVHPLDEHAAGPKATFATVFPTSGQYKIWGQFQRDGHVIVVPFVVNVK